MVLEVIYVIRHGFRSNWVVNPATGEYFGLTGPTGIPSDPALAGYGEIQARELGAHLKKIEPPVDVVYSSPFYRCLQTLKPFADKVIPLSKSGGKIKVENGIGEFYGLARFDHPSPASLEELQTHFPDQLDPDYQAILVPSKKGESILTLHDRTAYTIARIIDDLDKDPSSPRTLLICTHAAVMICLGRVLTGQMPAELETDDFKCFTCSLSRYDRRQAAQRPSERLSMWSRDKPETIPAPNWTGGRGVAGGWNCTANGDCSFLQGGEERGWKFSGDEGFLHDPNAFNDAANTAIAATDSQQVGKENHKL